MIYAIIASFIILDIVAGLSKAVYKGELLSKKMRQGLLHKFSYIIVLALAYLIDYSVPYVGLGFDTNTFELTAIFVCTTEIVSIIENVLEILPDNMGQTIRQIFHTKKDTENDTKRH